MAEPRIEDVPRMIEHLEHVLEAYQGELMGEGLAQRGFCQGVIFREAPKEARTAQALARQQTVLLHKLAGTLRTLLYAVPGTGLVVTRDVGRCQTCRAATASGMIKTCLPCAVAQARHTLVYLAEIGVGLPEGVGERETEPDGNG